MRAREDRNVEKEQEQIAGEKVEKSRVTRKRE